MIRIAVERSLGHIPGEDRNESTFILQYSRDFPNIFGK